MFRTVTPNAENPRDWDLFDDVTKLLSINMYQKKSVHRRAWSVFDVFVTVPTETLSYGIASGHHSHPKGADCRLSSFASLIVD